MTALFLGRTEFDENTRTYSFRDGSGRVPEEMKHDMVLASYSRTTAGGNGIYVLVTQWAWKERLGLK